MDSTQMRQTSLESQAEAQTTKASQMPTKAPRSWFGVSPVTLIQCLIVIVSLLCLILSVIPLGDLDTAGEQYEVAIALISGSSVAFLLTLVLNSAELALRRFRNFKTGIPTTWFFWLSIFILLCCMAAFALITSIVAIKQVDKDNYFINYDADWCRDKPDGELYNCKDGFFSKEPMFFVLMAFSAILMVLQGFLCCVWKKSGWNSQKSQRDSAIEA